MNKIPIEYWKTGEAKWDSHSAFKTTNHWHISHCGDEDSKSCDLMIVECGNGSSYFIENSWGDDTEGHNEVFNPFRFESYPTFFTTFDEANKRTAEIVSSITGADVSSLLIEV
ncbi:hypothetical protein [Aliivibrio fischeri]|uniref:hypothetical protein n=1 Tax=Aliivibrio fischeri TaxID=668 RepID=UPI0007C59725|nr:hypothetical protein [Aliivibrio fischeri]